MDNQKKHPRNSDETLTEQAVADLLVRVEGLLRSKRWAESYLGKMAVGDVKAIGRLREDRLVTRTVIKLEKFLDDQDASGVEAQR